MNPTDAARMGIGLACMTVPDQMLASLSVPRSTGRRRTVQVLGWRYLLHSSLNITVPGVGMKRASEGIDLVHAASMLALAAAAPTYRRAALTSAFLATGFAFADHAVHHLGPARAGGTP